MGEYTSCFHDEPSPLIALQIACCKLLHETIDFLCLPRQPEAFEECA